MDGVLVIVNIRSPASLLIVLSIQSLAYERSIVWKRGDSTPFTNEQPLGLLELLLEISS